jgi:hypothetical protein
LITKKSYEKKIKIYGIDEIFINFFGIKKTTLIIIQIKYLSENFEHTLNHLKNLESSLSCLKNLLKMEKYDSIELDEIHKLLSLQFKMRISELSYCFGDETYSISTNDYDSDSIEALKKLIEVIINNT